MSRPPPIKSPPRLRLRRLSPEEIDLWVAVAATVERRPGAILPGQPMPPVPEPEPVAFPGRPLAPKPTAQAPSPPQSRTGSQPAPLAPIERKLKQRLSRGRTTADAALDLHGLRQNEAFAALRHFLMRAQRDGCRVVLVVTGKGGRAGSGREHDGFGVLDVGVLRRQVPLWLAMPEFRPVVLGYEEAGRVHGGSGALYVRLRRGQSA